MTDPGRRRRRAVLLLAPALLVLVVCAAVPIGFLFRVALFPPGALAPLAGGPELDSFAALTRGPFPQAALGTLRLALLTTLLTTLLGFPAALFLSRSRGVSRTIQTVLVLTPLFLSPVVRAYGWTLILGREGLVGAALHAVGLPRAGLVGTEAAVLVGLTELFLPFTILALAASLDRRDPDLSEAARGLGASPLQTFLRVTLPLSAPGLTAGAAFAMAGSLAAVAAPALLGGPGAGSVALQIHELLTISFDWPTAAAASLLLLLAAALPLAAAALAGRRAAGAARA